MNPLSDARRALLTDTADGHVVALCALEEGGTVTVRGALATPADAGTAEALWAGWGPRPAGRPGRHPAAARVPWLVTLEKGDLRAWMGARSYDDAGDGRPGTPRDWWFARPLGGMPVRSATACFEPETGTVYVPYLAPKDGDAARGTLRFLWFRTGWRDEPAVPPPEATELLQAAAWSSGPDYAVRLLLFWLDESGSCRWGLWRRLEHEAWGLERAGLLGGVLPGAKTGAARGWHRLGLVRVPGGGTSAIALAAARPAGDRPGTKEPGAGDHRVAGDPLLARLDVAPDGTPRYLEYRLAGERGSGTARHLQAAEGMGAGEADLAGWWMEGDAALVLLARGGCGASATVEGWILPSDGAPRRLGAVPVSARHLAVARVAAAGTGPVTACRLPLLEDAGGHPQPWPVPSTWLDALRSSVVVAAELPGRNAGVPVLPAPAQPVVMQPVPAGHPWPTPARRERRTPDGPEPAAHPGPTLGPPARPPLPGERPNRDEHRGGGVAASEPAPRPHWRVVRQRSS